MLLTPDPEKPTVTSGVRLGTPAGTTRGFGIAEFRQVGDMIAAMSHNIGRVDRWTGAIHEVKKVTAKQFMVGGRWYEKATGMERGRRSSQYHYELATPDQIEANRMRAAERAAEDMKRGTFHARPEQKDVSAIFQLLSDMTPDDHPLDRLSPDEWAELRRRLGA